MVVGLAMTGPETWSVARAACRAREAASNGGSTAESQDVPVIGNRARVAYLHER
jgi:hypothetical protein